MIICRWGLWSATVHHQQTVWYSWTSNWSSTFPTVHSLWQKMAGSPWTCFLTFLFCSLGAGWGNYPILDAKCCCPVLLDQLQKTQQHSLCVILALILSPKAVCTTAVTMGTNCGVPVFTAGDFLPTSRQGLRSELLIEFFNPFLTILEGGNRNVDKRLGL